MCVRLVVKTHNKMQAPIYLPSSSVPFHSTKTSAFSNKLLFHAKHHHHQQQRFKSIKADTHEFDYSSMDSSVFPAEACETLGGVACDVEMFPETKPKDIVSNHKPTSQAVDREYLQYDNPKTVFIAEACDDLGGEFCEPAYQSPNVN